MVQVAIANSATCRSTSEDLWLVTTHRNRLSYLLLMSGGQFDRVVAQCLLDTQLGSVLRVRERNKAWQGS